MRAARLALALLTCVAVHVSTQARRDSAVTLYGFLEAAEAGGWVLVLREPFAEGRDRANLLAVRGDDPRWRRLEHRFVRAVGRVELSRALIVIEQIQEVEPPGIGRAEVHLSFNQMAVVTLAAIPNRFAWRLRDGQGSGVQPLLVYTVLNHGLTELDFLLPTNDVLCARVRATTQRAWWRTAVAAPTRHQQRIVIRLGGVYRQFVAVPPEAAPNPGRYVAHVTLCGVADYGVETQFDVAAPP